MTYYQLSCYLVVTVLVYRTVHNLVLFFRNRKQVYLLHFAFLQISYGTYLFFFIQTINAESIERALFWERLENTAVPFFGTFLVLFVNSYRRIFSRDFTYLYIFLNLLLSGILVTDPNAYTIELSHPRSFPYLGIIIYETKQPIIVQYLYLSGMLMIFWTLFKVMNQFLRNHFRNPFLLFGLILFCSSVILDILVATDVLPIPYTSHFSFLVLMFSVDSFLTVNKSEREVRLEFKESIAKWLHGSIAQSEKILNPKNDSISGSKQVGEVRSSPLSRKKAPNQLILKVKAMGPLELELDGKKISPSEYSSKKKLLKLIKLLVVRYGKGIHKEELLENLWPGMSEKNALNSLHALLFRLRKILGNPDALVFAEDRLYFHPDLVIADFSEFERELEQAHRLLRNKKEEDAVSNFKKAQEYYRGDFFEFDLYFPESDLKREYLRKNLIETYRILCEFSQKKGDFDALFLDSESWIRLDDLDERAWRYHFEALQQLDRKNEALRKFEDLKKILKKELGVEPEPDTISLIERIRTSSTVA
ncbi:bacterial transcriptional activator domain protein [Leptospira fainei serovar Hurstbridge str. BUT 6]|uniref:Bacterial transcriptional activator domain protein n=1 Tax=Leptospira fainei serovar Hurstbridge str. BUT 6 TaxID=1193011 RepID=S3UY26_9LEPT|nr:BTAD domain-containing putative transcriptional regulator [Leptospira fainei]EPG75321.1 bacterial transcriptional activator domain protein [Leptospira fainei serovar Hurstbridge str. BUT 6]